MSTKFRPQTRPILGHQLANIFDRIEELEKAAAARGGSGAGGGAPPGARPAPDVQAGQATTGANGKVTVTFPRAYGGAPVVVAVANNSGTDHLVAAIESVSSTQCVISVGKIAGQGQTGLYTGPGEAHQHAPGNYSVTIPAGTDGSSGTFGVAGVSAAESSHRHPAPADNVQHSHGRTPLSAVLVY